MNFESLQEVAGTFLQNGLFDRAEDIYTFVTTLYPANVSGWIGLGITRYHRENIEHALQAFDIATKLGCPTATPLLWKVECLLKTGLTEEAKAIFAQVHEFQTNLSESDTRHIQQMTHIFNLDHHPVGTL